MSKKLCESTHSDDFALSRKSFIEVKNDGWTIDEKDLKGSVFCLPQIWFTTFSGDLGISWRISRLSFVVYKFLEELRVTLNGGSRVSFYRP